MPVQAVAQVVQGLPSFADENLLIGPDDFSDAGVYRITDDKAIVQTLDFFPPVVDDPFVYGQIAAANSLSDVYAMGGQPTTALNIVGFPDDQLSLDVLEQILHGGADRVLAAGAVIVGGHSVRDSEIKYGLSVTGLVDPQKMMTNRAAKAGDVLVLTKALGTGFVSTAYRAGRCPDDVLRTACASMIQLSKDASSLAVALGARAATDVTGFGLAGHAYEMAQASNLTLRIDLGALPLLPGVESLASNANLSRSNATNRDHVAAGMRFECSQDDPRLGLLFDPQTSGGLLIAIDSKLADELVTGCHQAGTDAASVIGAVGRKQDRYLVIHS